MVELAATISFLLKLVKKMSDYSETLKEGYNEIPHVNNKTGEASLEKITVEISKIAVAVKEISEAVSSLAINTKEISDTLLNIAIYGEQLRAKGVLESALSLLDAGLLDDAWLQFQKARTLDPSNFVLWTGLAILTCAVVENQNEPSFPSLSQAISLESEAYLEKASRLVSASPSVDNRTKLMFLYTILGASIFLRDKKSTRLISIFLANILLSHPPQESELKEMAWPLLSIGYLDSDNVSVKKVADCVYGWYRHRLSEIKDELAQLIEPSEVDFEKIRLMLEGRRKIALEEKVKNFERNYDFFKENTGDLIAIKNYLSTLDSMIRIYSDYKVSRSKSSRLAPVPPSQKLEDYAVKNGGEVLLGYGRFYTGLMLIGSIGTITAGLSVWIVEKSMGLIPGDWLLVRLSVVPLGCLILGLVVAPFSIVRTRTVRRRLALEKYADEKQRYDSVQSSKFGMGENETLLYKNMVSAKDKLMGQHGELFRV